jgi:hypothetical protein
MAWAAGRFYFDAVLIHQSVEQCQEREPLVKAPQETRSALIRREVRADFIAMHFGVPLYALIPRIELQEGT